MTTTATPVTSIGTAASFLAVVKDSLRAVSNRALPVMSGLRLESDGHRLTVTGYDYETSITRRLDASGVLPACLVPAFPLRDALARLDQRAPVAAAVEDGKFLLTQDRKRVTLSLLEIEDYPDLPVIEGPDFLIAGDRLARLAASVTPFVGKDDMLPVLQAVHLVYDGGELLAQVTDRFRAAEFRAPVLASNGCPANSVLMPYLGTIGPLFAGEHAVSVTFLDDYARLTSDDVTVTVRLIDGSFPRISALFPTEFATLVEFEPLAFLKALKFVEAGVERNTAIMFATTGDTNVTLSTNADSEVAMSDECPARVVGEQITTGYNPAFLADAVKVYGKGHDVRLSLTTSTKPAVITCESIPELRVLLMPRRLAS